MTAICFAQIDFDHGQYSDYILYKSPRFDYDSLEICLQLFIIDFKPFSISRAPIIPTSHLVMNDISLNHSLIHQNSTSTCPEIAAVAICLLICTLVSSFM